jgi:FKBP-type peptidyl-prolyl cis-trans isomerase 2
MNQLKPSHNPNTKVKHKSLVTVHYVGKLADGSIFESTDKKPLRIFVGEHAVIPGLEEGLLGMRIGEKKRIVVNPNKGYGAYLKDLVQEIPLSKIPPEVTPVEGMVFTQESRSGRTIYTKVIKVNRDTVIIDLNHPLAGKTLVFDLVVMGIQGP